MTGKRRGNRGKTRKSRATGTRGGANAVRTAVNRSPFFCAPRQRTTLTYESRGTYTVAGTFINTRTRPTNPYDFDPAAGTTPVPGFVEWAGLYRKFRVIRAHQVVEFVNNEAFAVEVYVMPFNYDPGASVNPVPFLSNAECKRALLSAKGGGRDGRTLHMRKSVANFGGSASTRVEDAYVGLVDGSAPPSDNFYFSTGILNSAAVSVSGVYAITKLMVEVEFFEYQAPAT